MTPDAKGEVTLVDRDTGKDHVCTTITAKEILAQTENRAVDGGPRYVDKDEHDGKVARGKAAKTEPTKVEPVKVEPAKVELEAAELQ